MSSHGAFAKKACTSLKHDILICLATQLTSDNLHDILLIGDPESDALSLAPPMPELCQVVSPTSRALWASARPHSLEDISWQPEQFHTILNEACGAIRHCRIYLEWAGMALTVAHCHKSAYVLKLAGQEFTWMRGNLVDKSLPAHILSLPSGSAVCSQLQQPSPWREWGLLVAGHFPCVSHHNDGCLHTPWPQVWLYL